MKRLDLALPILSLLLAACSHSDNSSSQATAAPAQTDAPTEAPTAKVIISKNDYQGLPYDVVVGHRVYVMEGFTSDEDGDQWAQTLITAREAGNKSGIETAYGISSYRHYGNSNEDKPPACMVQDQDAVSIHTGQDLGDNSPEGPIHCKLDDGTDIYATNLTAP